MTFICMKVESGLIFYNIAEVQAHKRPVLFTPECSSGCNCTQKSLSHSADGRWEALAASLRPQIPVPKLPGSDQWDPGCETACMLPQKRPARKWTALPNACLHNPSTTHTHFTVKHMSPNATTTLSQHVFTNPQREIRLALCHG